MFRGLTRPVRLDVVESCAGAEVDGDGDTMAIDLRAVPVPRCVQGDRAADAEVRPEDRAAQADGDAAVDPDRQFDVLSDTRQLARKVVAVQQERRQCRRRLDDCVSEAPGDAEAGAVAAGFRQRLAAGGENHVRARDAAVRGDDIKAVTDFYEKKLGLKVLSREDGFVDLQKIEMIALEKR